MSEEDRPFLFSSWLRSYKAESAFAKRIKNEVYYFWHHQMVEAILRKPSSRVLVAHKPDESDIIIGYLVYELVNGEPKIAHYCFIKELFRKMGIAKALFDEAGFTKNYFFTHFTYSIETFVNKRGDLTYDPYRI